MAARKKTAKQPEPPAPAQGVTPAPRKIPTRSAGKKSAPPAAAKPTLPPALAKRVPPAFSRMPSDDRAPSGKPGDADDPKNRLSKQQIDAIRLLALTMAGPELGDDAVMICNPISEPPALPLSELLYDRCKWCEVDIYYDRLMPSRPDLMRVCLKCGIMLLEAEKKGAN
jgi:hypothetical protein